MPIPLRSDYDAARVRVAARESKNANQVRRLLALAAIYDGASRAEAAEIGGVTRQIIRDWVLKFNTDGPDGLIDRKAPGQPSRLNETHRTALAAAIESGPLARISQRAPTARITSGGRFHPDSSRFDLVADERLVRVTGRVEAS
jgi:hypothetical protein